MVLSLGCVEACTFNPAPLSEVLLGSGKLDTFEPGDPVISFSAEGSVTQSALLIPGSLAKVHYDTSRLKTCRGLNWNIMLSYQADATEAHSFELLVNGVATDLMFTVPLGHDLAIWFDNEDSSGCSDSDSRNGNDYHFSIAPPPGGVIHFQSGDSIKMDGTTDGTATGPLPADEPILVDYDLSRLPECRAAKNGRQTWDVIANWRFDQGVIESDSLTRAVANGTERIANLLELTPPAGSQRLEMWFENSDGSGCARSDSNFGNNFIFELK